MASVLRRLGRLGGFCLLVLMVVGCSSSRFEARQVPPPAKAPAVAAAEAPLAEMPAVAAPAASPPRVETVLGNQRFVAPSRSHGAATGTSDGRVSLNFVSVDVRDVAKAVLGDILGLKYVVEANATGNVTVETAQPIGRDEVLPTLETSLKSAGLGLIRRDQGYAIVPLAEASRQPALVGRETVGYGTEAVTLRYVNATALKKLFDPMVPERSIQADPSRNVLLVTGSSTERVSLRAMVEQFDVDWLAGMSFSLITLQRADARRLTEELNQIVNSEGSPSAGLVRLVPLTRLNAIVVISPQPRYIDDVRYWAEELDREGEGGERRLFVYRVQSGRASNLANVLSGLFGGAAGNQAAASTAMSSSMAAGGSVVGTTGTRNTGSAFPQAAAVPQRDPAQQVAGQQLRLAEGGASISVTSDDTNNAIVIYATSREYEIVEKALRKLDVMPLQVLIEAMITEVTLNDALRYGVEWYFKTGMNNFSLTSGTTKSPKQTFPGFSYLLSNQSGIQAVVNALDDVTNVNVVSSPQLLVLNNQTASLQVGDQVPISTQSSVSTVTSGSPVVNSIEYRDTGVILKVTPRVNDSGLVLLDISQEVSDVSTTTSSNLDSPTIQQRKISSSVAVQDGQTVALGGLIRDNLKRTKSGVPLLNDVPLLGPLFGTTDNTRDRTELLVLLTPHVVRNANDAQAITDELRRNILTVTPITSGKEPGR
ncbi:type II secretion system secretin GspD [Magnetospirillum sp. 15-1]|uniref:type II secretion system secretin GspD n=1 Tax=Magnetospirillum sp. 15-1 TaxID=1979370 RepID=UPI001F5B9F97|nr:type II secretion system secretin GspD [Magnetospirillum sp. 15-1]